MPALLKSRRFLPLFITQFFGAFNDNAFKNAFLIWFTFDAAEKNSMDPAFMVTLAAAIFILPFFLFSATAGNLSDKYEKSQIARIVKVVEVLLMLAAAIFFYFENVFGLLLILFFMGAHSTFFGPIKYSLLPEHLKKNELLAGNGLIEGGTFLAILTGTIFGGLVILGENGKFTLSFFVILFALIGLVASFYIPKSLVGDSDIKLKINIFSDTLKTLNFAHNNAKVLIAIIGISWFWLVGATFLTQFPLYTKEIIGGNEEVVTFFLTIFSIGVAVGSVVCIKLQRGEINTRLVPYGCLGMTVFIIDFYFVGVGYVDAASRILYEACSPGVMCGKTLLDVNNFLGTKDSWRVIFDLFMISFCAGIYTVPLYTLVQSLTKRQYLARTIAANNVYNALFMVISSLAIMVMYWQGFGVLEVLLAVGVLNVLIFVGVLRGI